MYAQERAVIVPELVPVVAARFRALGEPGRLEILQSLQAGERSVGELAALTGRSQPNVSQHLGHLARAGLVEARREGTRALYRVSDPYLARICAAVCDSLAERAAHDGSRLAALARRRPSRRVPKPAAASARRGKKAARP